MEHSNVSGDPDLPEPGLEDIRGVIAAKAAAKTGNDAWEPMDSVVRVNATIVDDFGNEVGTTKIDVLARCHTAAGLDLAVGRVLPHLGDRQLSVPNFVIIEPDQKVYISSNGRVSTTKPGAQAASPVARAPQQAEPRPARPREAAPAPAKKDKKEASSWKVPVVSAISFTVILGIAAALYYGTKPGDKAGDAQSEKDRQNAKAPETHNVKVLRALDATIKTLEAAHPVFVQFRIAGPEVDMGNPVNAYANLKTAEAMLVQRLEIYASEERSLGLNPKGDAAIRASISKDKPPVTAQLQAVRQLLDETEGMLRARPVTAGEKELQEKLGMQPRTRVVMDGVTMNDLRDRGFSIDRQHMSAGHLNREGLALHPNARLLVVRKGDRNVVVASMHGGGPEDPGFEAYDEWLTVDANGEVQSIGRRIIPRIQGKE